MRIDDRPELIEHGGERGVILKMLRDGEMCIVQLDGSNHRLACGVDLVVPEEEWPWPK